VAGKQDMEAAYVFRLWADDGCRLLIDGTVVIDDWRACAEDDPSATRSATVTLTPGRHAIVVEYFQGQSLATNDQDPAKLYWECSARGIERQIVPADNFFHTAEDLKPEPGRNDAPGL